MILAALLIISIIFIWINSKNSIFIMIFPTLGFILSILSSTFLDFGIYNVELEMTTNKNYSGLVYYVYMLPIFLSQSYAFRKDINFKHNYVTHYLVYFVLFILIFNYTISPKPYYFLMLLIELDIGIHLPLPFLSQIFGSMASFIPFYFGILLRIGYKKTSIVSFLIYIIYIILIGQKGGSLIQSLIFYIFPYSLKYIRKKRNF